jgi:molybdate transport system substrate-binding protein
VTACVLRAWKLAGRKALRGAVSAIAVLAFAFSAHAESLTIAAAADLKFAMDELLVAYRKINPTDSVVVSYGSSGQFHTQIQQGAPFDMFFSADISFPRELAEHGLAAGEPKPYAFGRIVLWSSTLDATQMTLASLADSKVTRIAIANPKHAPYGKRAEEALRAAGVWEQVQPKLVFGENIAQTAQFVSTGNAQVGIVALSLALNAGLADKGGYWLIPDTLHQPLEQGFVTTQRAASNPAAGRFADYISSKPARAVLTRYGFVLPLDASGK